MIKSHISPNLLAIHHFKSSHTSSFFHQTNSHTAFILTRDNHSHSRPRQLNNRALVSATTMASPVEPLLRDQGDGDAHMEDPLVGVFDVPAPSPPQALQSPTQQQVTSEAATYSELEMAMTFESHGNTPASPSPEPNMAMPSEDDESPPAATFVEPTMAMPFEIDEPPSDIEPDIIPPQAASFTSDMATSNKRAGNEDLEMDYEMHPTKKQKISHSDSEGNTSEEDGDPLSAVPSPKQTKAISITSSLSPSPEYDEDEEDYDRVGPRRDSEGYNADLDIDPPSPEPEGTLGERVAFHIDDDDDDEDDIEMNGVRQTSPQTTGGAVIKNEAVDSIDLFTTTSRPITSSATTSAPISAARAQKQQNMRNAARSVSILGSTPSAQYLNKPNTDPVDNLIANMRKDQHSWTDVAAAVNAHFVSLGLDPSATEKSVYSRHVLSGLSTPGWRPQTPKDSKGKMKAFQSPAPRGMFTSATHSTSRGQNGDNMLDAETAANTLANSGHGFFDVDDNEDGTPALPPQNPAALPAAATSESSRRKPMAATAHANRFSAADDEVLVQMQGDFAARFWEYVALAVSGRTEKEFGAEECEKRFDAI